MNKAWHLRQDGKAFPVKVHIYCMGDEDLSSEAEAAAFIINTNSQDINVAEYTLDAWMALLIEQEVSYDADELAIEEAIKSELGKLPYKFQYPLSVDTLVSIHKKQKNYNDVDTLYEFTDKVRDSIFDVQENIRRSINQQFCRVRYGGQYNSLAGNNEIWFRVSSVGYNWANTIYEYTSSIKRSYNIQSISICRDAESDEGFDSNNEYFYKAKDGTLYQHMPIDEFLREEHEHSMYFESINVGEGIIKTFRDYLARGNSYIDTAKYMKESFDYDKDLWRYLLKKERTQCVSTDRINKLPNRKK